MGSRLRPRLEAWLNRRWYEGVAPEWPLRLLAGLQSQLVRLNLRRAKHAWKAPIPLVVIGNLTAGGSGKTPVVIWLAQTLTRRGFRVAVVSRGYGRSAHSVRILDDTDDWREVGDEPLLIHRRTGCPVAVGKDRPAACQALLAQYSLDIILADDGLQHYRLQRDREILVIDSQRRFGNGRLLPAGPLREPVERVQAVDWRVWNGGCPEGEEGLAMRTSIRQAINLRDGECLPLANFKPGPVHAVAGIGAPQRFFGSLEHCGIQVLPHTPGDHGEWDGRSLGQKPVLMTEKDAVKLSGPAQGNWWQVPLEVEMESPEALLDDLCSLMSGDSAP